MSDDTTSKKKREGGGKPAPPSKAVLEFMLRLPDDSWLEQKPEVAVILPWIYKIQGREDQWLKTVEDWESALICCW